jgi:hypothetical protein
MNELNQPAQPTVNPFNQPLATLEPAKTWDNEKGKYV